MERHSKVIPRSVKEPVFTGDRSGVVTAGEKNPVILKQRFLALWNRCANTPSEPESIWELLRACYQEPHRHYHTLGHIGHCLGELDSAGANITEPEVTEMALWFHDVIYQYGSAENETLSAALFAEHSRACMPAEFVQRVNDFIIATRHTGAAEDLGSALMVDLDLSGFGLPWDEYLADSDALRLEAPHISDEQYYAGKLRFLTSLQQWPSLFQSSYFRERLEERAHVNIRRYVAQLYARGFTR